ncbi:MAG: glutamate-1-semialdehyde 2,1-aminomutase [Nitriliruptorales bacterium]|nr:glutamate-1-semialdehyde 2,1-aminomutase [Nitriliruptorales bacterium]
MTSSAELFDRAQKVIPGGVNSPVRAFGSVGGTPPFIVSGEGAHILDEDGNRYVDLVQSWGPLPLGHARSEIVAAARGATQRGSTFGAPTLAEVVLAETICEAVPSVDSVRLVSSGTEAAMSAVRLARGHTGRDRILKFAGHYHGHSDALLASAGSGVATLGIPGSPGVTRGATSDTIVVDWNDRDAVVAAVDEHAEQLAAIICEPLPANMSLVPPAEGFLAFLRQEADRVGALLVFDEVITGFRIGRGGMQAEVGVIPDLTVLGKVVGGGFPLAAFGGRADVMASLAPVGPVYQAGTLSGNPVAVAAGIAQLELLTSEVYEQLRGITDRLVTGLRGAFDMAGVPVQITRHGTLAALLFSDSTPTRYADVQAADHQRYQEFFHAMLDRGVYLAPSGYEVMFPSVAHGSEALDQIVDAAVSAAASLR